MTRIIGTIEPGDKKAHINLVILIPQLAQHCPEITNYGKDGTINVHLAHSFPTEGNADCWTPRITWKPDPITKLGDLRDEAFGFIKIKFEFPLDGQTYYDAWIILPEGIGSTYSDDRAKIEVIAAAKIEGIEYREQCAIHFHTPVVPRPPWFSKNAASYGHLLTVALILRHSLGSPHCNDCLRDCFHRGGLAATIDEIRQVTDRMSIQECFLQANDVCVRCNQRKPTIKAV